MTHCPNEVLSGAMIPTAILSGLWRGTRAVPDSQSSPTLQPRARELCAVVMSCSTGFGITGARSFDQP